MLPESQGLFVSKRDVTGCFKGTVDMDKLIANIPDELKKQKSWVGFVLKPNGKRFDKIPMNVMTGKPAKTNDSQTWADFESALNL